MKSTVFAAVLAFGASLVSAAALPEAFPEAFPEALPAAPPAGTSELGYQLGIDAARTIVAQYQAALQNKTYNNQTPRQSMEKVLNVNYQEYSDSVLSLISKNNTMGALVAKTREEWFAGAQANPVRNVVTNSLYVAGRNQIIWYWTMSGIGINKLPVTGFNLFRIDTNLQIYEADIEFNAIAWGLDIFALGQYCPPPAQAATVTVTVTATPTATASATSSVAATSIVTATPSPAADAAVIA